jgi:hypothetical protein
MIKEEIPVATAVKNNCHAIQDITFHAMHKVSPRE